MRADIIKNAQECKFPAFRPLRLLIMQLLILTRIHYGLPLAAPLAELLGVLFFHLCSLHEARHNVVAGLEGLFGPLHCTHIIPRLGGGKTVVIRKNNCSAQPHKVELYIHKHTQESSPSRSSVSWRPRAVLWEGSPFLGTCLCQKARDS